MLCLEFLVMEIFESLFDQLPTVCARFPDARSSRGVKYSMADIGSFGVFPVLYAERLVPFSSAAHGAQAALRITILFLE
jgi:hypothetical protein